MNKIIVDIFVPAVDYRCDVLLSSDIVTYRASQLIATAIEKQTGGIFVVSTDSILCDRLTGQMLDVNKTLANQDIKNGSQLMLI